MKVSVLMATYNGEAYLCEQIDSLLRQSYADFDLYISDDGSQDKTLPLLEEYRAKYPEKIHLSQRKTGSAKENFLRLLETVESDLYLFCDQDDVWTDNHIEAFVSQYATLSDEQKTAPVLIHSDLTVMDSAMHIISESFFQHGGFLTNPSRHFYFTMNNVTGCASMINDALKCCVFRNAESLYKNMDSIIMHDHLFATVAAEFGVKIVLTHSTVFYRQHEKNACGAGEERTLSRLLRKIVTLSQYKTSLSSHKTSYSKHKNFCVFFADYFSEFLDSHEKNVLADFTALNRKRKARRIIFLVQNGFLPSGIVRTLWQFFVA